MTTLMSWGNSDGIKGRCDDKCHSAKSLKCTCMCGGRYHGAALNGKLEAKIHKDWDEIEKKAREMARKQGFDITFTDKRPLEKMPLFAGLAGKSKK